MTALRHLTNDEPVERVLDVLADGGAVIVDQMLDDDLLQRFRHDMEVAAKAIDAGTRADDATIRNFWGDVTKRFTRLASRSSAFIDILLHPTLLGVADALLLPNCSSYW